MSGSDEPFIKRWSRRKQAANLTGSAESEATSAAGAAAPRAGEPVQELPPQSASLADPPTPKSTIADRDEAAGVEPSLADIDFDALDFSSDYTRFMQPGVSDEIRNKALRKLWVSDPVLANMDGLHDYFGDYTDKAVASAPVTSLYKVGRGFLSDHEVAEWEELGKPVNGLELCPGFRARAGRPTDGPALLEVHRRSILGPGAESYSREEAASWAAGLVPEGYGRAMADGEAFDVALTETDPRIVAFCSRKDEQLCGLYVDPDFVRKGIGGALLRRAEAKLSAAGHDRIAVTASLSALPFYLAHGYRKLGEDEQQSRGGLMLRVALLEKALAT